MEITGELDIDADAKTVWEIVSNPEALVHCIPGADEVERVSEREYTGRITKRVAGFEIQLDGTVELTDLDPHRYMAANARGTDNRSGTWTSLNADAEMALREYEGKTTVDYEISMDVNGRLASLGTHLVEPVVRSNVDAFFDALVERAEGTKTSQ